MRESRMYTLLSEGFASFLEGLPQFEDTLGEPEYLAHFADWLLAIEEGIFKAYRTGAVNGGAFSYADQNLNDVKDAFRKELNIKIDLYLNEVKNPFDFCGVSLKLQKHIKKLYVAHMRNCLSAVQDTLADKTAQKVH